MSRFKARLDHFRFFVYGGISGIGKTSLLLRFAKETRAVGLRGAVYLPLWPGEAISSILARVEAHSGGGRTGAQERPGDPYARLADYLEKKRLALVLDDLHHLRREDLQSLVRATRTHEGNYRIITAGMGEPELSAIDRMQVHLERVGPLTPAEVRKLSTSAGVRGEALERLETDAARGGCCAHALTLRFLLGIFKSDLPPPEFFEGQSARSVSAFRSIMAEAGTRLDRKEAEALAAMARVGVSVSKPVVTRVFGAAGARLLKRGMLTVMGTDVYVHGLVGQVLNDPDYKLSDTAAKALSAHLQERGVTQNEPLRVLRAAELLARIGASVKAVDTLTTVWTTARDFGFLEAYLKTVASIPSKPQLEKRLKLLAARARMRQGSITSVRDELEALAGDRDSWTRSRALAALTYVYSALGEHKKVVASFDAVRRTSVGNDLLVPAATSAALAMVKTGNVPDAEKLARSMLSRIASNKKFLDREGELRRLLARIYSRSGRLTEAVREAQAAAKAFEGAGDLYHAATAHGFIGDLYRETGDFELAKGAFVRFHALAEKWGDRDLLQVAELAESWVSLDVGDLTHAAKQIAAVEKEMSAAPSKRLKRYLAAAKALLEAGRGRHESAAAALVPVIELWRTSGQRAIADLLRAQRVRSLIACNDLDKARRLVDEALGRLNPKSAAPRVASFLRESALIRLRNKDVKTAMAELAQARKLFATGGNRREEALTLHRIAHAALEEGDLELATASVKEALTLARKIKHPRVIAQCRELQGRVALINDNPKTAVTATKEALQSLRKLGDELGTLHVSESLLRSLIVAGDLAGAIRLGPKVSDQAEKLEIREVRVRAIVLTGVALLRRHRVDAATRCFRELPEQAFSPLTTALMWRLGEALASVGGKNDELFARREKWVAAVRRLPEAPRAIAVHLLEQLDLPPRERCILRTPGQEPQLLGTEEIGFLQLDQYDLFVDVANKRIIDGGQPITITSPELHKLFNRLVIAYPDAVPNASVYEAAYSQPPVEKFEKKLKAPLRQLEKALKNAQHIEISQVDDGFKLTPPKRYAFLIPRDATIAELNPYQRRIMRILGQLGTLPVQTIQDKLKLNRSAARRELGELIKRKLVQTVRDGRGQAFRIV